MGVGDGQGGLACCNSWGHKELDRTEQLNLTELAFQVALVVKNPPANAGDLRDAGLIPGQEDPLEEGMANPLQYSGESHGQRSLVGYNPWGHKESDMTEAT